MDDRKRKYDLTDLPTIVAEKPEDKEKQIDLLKLIYGEANSNYRNLADTRFKLLGFVPAVSLLAWATLYKDIEVVNLANVISGIIISLLGFLITYGVRIYDKRNDELYDDLISRARKIEDELGIHTGLFKGRLEANKIDVFRKKINHGRALDIIYSSVFVGWGFMILWYIFNLVQFIFT